MPLTSSHLELAGSPVVSGVVFLIELDKQNKKKKKKKFICQTMKNSNIAMEQ